MSNFDRAKETVSGSISFDLKGFTERMEQILGDESARSFGLRCGLSDTAIKKYRADTSTPNVERLIAIANAAGVDVKWLATGEASPGSDLREEESQPEVVWIDSDDVFASAGNCVHNDWDHLEARVPFASTRLESHDLQGKRLQSDLMGGLYIKSDNPAYREIHISPSNKPDDIRIIAKWTGKKIQTKNLK